MLNKKAQQYGMSGGKKFLIFLIIISILIGVSYYYNFMNTRNMIKNFFTNGKEKVNDAMSSDVGSSKNEFQPYTPEINLNWCNAQNIPVTNDENLPQSIKILGVDNINACCIKTYSGYNNCLNNSAEFNICYTAEIGGTIVYSKLNSKYVNPQYYQTYIKDIDKIYNPNFRKEVVCDLEIYN